MTPNKEEIASWFDDENAAALDLDDAVIVYACYETGNWEGEWCVVFVEDGQWYEASGGHCSCNSPEWDPTKTTPDEIIGNHEGRDYGSHKDVLEAVTRFAAAMGHGK